MNGATWHRTAALAKTASNALIDIDGHPALVRDGGMVLAGLDTYQALYALIPRQAGRVIDMCGPDLQLLLTYWLDRIYRANLLTELAAAHPQ